MISQQYKSISFLALLIFLLAFFPAQAQPPWVEWKNKTSPDNVLIGKIWSARSNGLISPSMMIQELTAAKYVLAGEVHDNRDHHLLQAWIIDQLVKSDKSPKPAIVMEMIRNNKSEVLANYMRDPAADSTGLANVLQWEKSGWPQWSFYEPIADVIFENELQLFAGDSDRASIGNVSRKGFASLAPDEISRLSLDIQLSPDLEDALDTEIINAHCKLLPSSMIKPMVKVQRFRDASIASAMVGAADGDNAGVKVVLIAGNGHIRTDRAAPWYLARQDKNSVSLSIMMIEVGDESAGIDELLKYGPGKIPAADYFWFTPKVQREDQCEKLRKMFKKKNQ